MKLPTKYVHLQPEMTPPAEAGGAPFIAVLIAEGKSSVEWQALVSEWLLESGCLYMVVWGETSSSWDDSVDSANMKKFGFGEIPDEKFVMTAWFSHDPLEEAFWFAKHTAVHPAIELARTVLVHISDRDSESELLKKYADA